MPNALYGKGREKFLNGNINWTSDTIRAILVDTAAYTVNIDVDEFITAVPGGARIGSPVTLGTKTSALGVADAADIQFSGLSSAPTIEAIVIYKDTGTEGTSPLIAYIDTGTGLPVAANATAVDVQWSNGSDRIFRL